MSEIAKLYENAGVKKQYCGWLDMGDLDTNVQYVRCATKEEYDDCVALSCADLIQTTPNEEYPPFTAEKQIAIIKLISKQGQVIIENWEKDNRGFNVTFRANSNLRYITMDCITRKTVEEALAKIVNDIWQDLTEKEKQQIKEILE